jgi:hypothetical protein
MKLYYFASAENQGKLGRINALFPISGLADAGPALMMIDVFNGWGAVRMPKRFRDFLLGTADAVPGDYVLALVATLGMMLAVMVSML